ncbi:MAG: TonB-dependent receptor [Bacteroidales bacterium]|jgi:iron complex outermembrane receptor protein|nr:TonB-dependent receptor [Bacteroidales bacterium]
MQMPRFNYQIFVLLIFFFTSVPATANATVPISGTVIDSKGDPVVGVNIVEKNNSSQATTTDINGRFTLQATSPDVTLVFSFIGMSSIETTAREANQTTLTLSTSSKTLSQVVVIGYGTATTEKITGAVTSVSEKDLLKGSASADRMLMGKVAGVVVTPNGGAPGSGSRIRIRGSASISAGKEPLIVIDGIPLENRSVAGSPSLLSTINPNEIESMTILKDASATAIYGNRASNGVVLIVTKKADLDKKVKIDFSTRFSASTTANRVKLLSAEQITDIVSPRQPELLGTASTDWQSEIYRVAMGTDNNLSISKGGVVPFRVSAGYLNENGLLKTSNMERASVGINLNPRFFKNHLKIDVSLKGSMMNNRFANTSAIGSALMFDPTQSTDFMWTDAQAGVNPLLLLDLYSNKSRVWRGIASASIDYKMHFLPELRAILNLAYDYSQGSGNTFIPETMPVQVLSRPGGTNTDYGGYNQNKLLEFYLNYSKEVPSIKSTFDVTAGYAYQDWKEHTTNYPERLANGDIYKTPTFPFNEPRYTLLSFFGRLNYSFMDRYMLSASIRTDGSSRFAPENRWGVFPAIALAWQIKNENFLKDIDVVSALKLRVGYGKTGQQDIGNYYPYLAVYTQGTAQVRYQLGDEFYDVLRPNAYDRNIKWESTGTYNIGIDYGFLNNRINGSIDFYYKKTDNLLNTIPVAAGSNFSNRILTNIGNMENKGVEIALNAILIQTKDWSWDIGVNLAYNKNKITKLTLVEDPAYRGVQDGWISGGLGATAQVHSVGYSMYTFYLYEQVYDTDGKPIEGVYVDQNGDNKINEDDLQRLTSAEPFLTGGFTTNLRYRNWTLSTSLRGSLGNYMYNDVASNMAFYSNIFRATSICNAPESVLNSGFNNQRQLTDYYLEDASFLRMDNLSLSYDFSDLLKNKVGLVATFSVQNVFVLTKYTGLDPEISGGIDRDFYPRPRIFALGINFNF